MKSKRFKPLALLVALFVALSVPVVLDGPAMAEGEQQQENPTYATYTQDNLTVTVGVTGEPNGPYNITFTAKQDEAEGTQWGASSVLQFNLLNVVTFSQEDVVVPAGVTVTKCTDYNYEFSGYDYSANVGTPLTVTIQNAELNLDTETVKNAYGPTNLDLMSTVFNSVGNGQGAFFYLPAVKLPVIGVGQFGPEPVWNGKTVSWEANAGAESYMISYSLVGSGEDAIEEEVTGTSKDLTDFINQHGEGRYYVTVAAKRGDLVTFPNGSDKYWFTVRVTPSVLRNRETTYELSTDGGTFTGTVVSGDTGDAFGAPDDSGVIEGIFAAGDTIRLSASAAQGYDFEKWNQLIARVEGQWDWTSSTENPFEFTVEREQTALKACFKQQEEPVEYATVTLQLGDAHTTLAASNKLKQSLESAGFSEVAANGSAISAKFPKINEYDDTTTLGFARQRLSQALSSATTMGVDAQEAYVDIALQSPENYTSYEALYEEQQDTYSDQLQDGRVFYVLWAKAATSVKLSVEKPTCGTNVTAEPYDPAHPELGYNSTTQSPRPSITVTEGNAELWSDPYMGDSAFWVTPNTGGYGMPKTFVGTIEGGQTYHAIAMLDPSFGYYFADNTQVTVEGGSLVSAQVMHGEGAQITLSVVAVHDWGDWSVTTPATVDAEGEETRVCKTNSEHKETRPIDKLVSVAACTVAPIDACTYDGTQHKPEPTVTDSSESVLVKDQDYELTYGDNTNAGTGTVTITGKGKYGGETTVEFTIDPATITSAVGQKKTYNGQAQTTTWTVKAGDLDLAEGDYDVSGYASNTNAGTASATITGKTGGNFTGSVTGEFTIDPATITSAVGQTKTYNGQAQTTTWTVKAGDLDLAEGDYDVSDYASNTDAGRASATVAAKAGGNLTGSVTGSFTIVPARITSAVGQTKTYNGSAQTTTWSVHAGEVELADGDYDVSGYASNTNAGTATATVAAKAGGNFMGSVTGSFTIAPATITSAVGQKKTYNGQAQTTTWTVKAGDLDLAEGDYEASGYASNTNVGTASATITGKTGGNFTGSVTGEFTIEAAKVAVPATADFTYDGKAQTGVAAGEGYELGGTASATDVGTYKATANPSANYTWEDGTTDAKELTWKISAATITSAIGEVRTYNGKAQETTWTVKAGELDVPADGFEATDYEDNTNAGTAKAKVTAKSGGNFTGSVTGEFTIEAAKLTSAVGQTKTYDGTAQTTTWTVKAGELELTEGDYDVSDYASNTNAGTATATITAKESKNITGSVTGEFTISPVQITSAVGAAKTYNGKAQTTTWTVKAGDFELAAGDYEASAYKTNTNAGTASAIITGKGNFAGSVTGEFTINPAKITSAVGAAKTYNGKAQTTMWTVKAGSLNVPATGFSASAYKANTNAGTASATIKGKGNFTGSVTGKFKVNPAKITAVTTVKTAAYTGKAVKPKLTVKAGGIVVPAAGYTVTWTNNIKAGTATVTVTGKGNFTGSAKTTFKIVAPSVQYKAHVQTTGWESSWKKDGQPSGTTAKSKRLEGLYVKLAGGFPVSGGIRYRAKVQGAGWEAWKKDGQLAGTTGKSKRVEVIRIELTGNMAKSYDVYYRVHVQKVGWLSWAKNGADVGSTGYNYRIEAIQIVLVPKGAKAPAATYQGVKQQVAKPLIKK